jgi:hypothetical protein
MPSVPTQKKVPITQTQPNPTQTQTQTQTQTLVFLHKNKYMENRFITINALKKLGLTSLDFSKFS